MTFCLHFHFGFLFSSPATRSRREENSAPTPCLRTLYAHFTHGESAFGDRLQPVAFFCAVLYDTQITSACPDRVRVPSRSPLSVYFASESACKQVFRRRRGKYLNRRSVNMRSGGDLGVRMHRVCFPATGLV